ncbi:DUF2344 domain-containing protein [Lachnospiraceae bacterium WCA-693-APC-MOT-I]|uniref:DUF2344 domain-containing protein n=1 Tax=Velocimicrobium porci TaxID=2606634 RepID=A0A6L5XYS0_9FIRM|nr:DUF2344 domain-containing protein [Velocimicrobium porci]
MKARMKFNKSGSMKFIGHLDVMRYFQKAIRRSDIDVAYSTGYSPHQLLSFASPLGVGLTSDGEYLDIQLNSTKTSKEMIESLNGVMTEEMQVTSFRILPEDSKTSMSLLAAADYLISVKDGYQTIPNFKEKFESFINQKEIKIIKKTKKSEKEVDLKPFIYAYGFTKPEFEEKIGRNLGDTTAGEYKNGIKVYLQLTCGSVNNIKPELVLEAFCQANNWEYNPFAYQIHRIELYTDTNAKKGEINPNGSQTKRNLVPLDQFGEIA